MSSKKWYNQIMPEKIKKLIFRFPENLADLVGKRADRFGRSLNSELIILLKRGLAADLADDEAVRWFEEETNGDHTDQP